MKRTAIRRVSTTQRARTQAWTEFRREVWKRDDHRCCMCGQYLHAEQAEVHHRQLKSRGGQDVHPNTLTLCHFHHRAVHSQPAWARKVGLMVPASKEPSDWPVLLNVSRGQHRLSLSMLWQVPNDAGEWVCRAPHPDQSASPAPWEVAS